MSYKMMIVLQQLALLQNKKLETISDFAKYAKSMNGV